MATLSTKLPAALAEAFELWAEGEELSTSAALRSLVEIAVRFPLRLEMDHPLIAEPYGWAFVAALESEPVGPTEWKEVAG